MTCRAVLLSTVAALVTVLGCEAAPTEPPPPVPSPPTTAPPPPAEPEDAPSVSEDPVVREDVIPLPGGAPEGAVVDPASGVLAVALREPNRLALVDTATRQVRTVEVPGAARHLVLGAPGELLVLAEDTDLLVRVALPEGKVIGQTPVGRQPHDAGSVGDTVFVANEFGGTVGVVRGGTMVDEIPGLVQPGGLTATRNRVAAVDVRGNTMHVIDPATLDTIAVLPAGEGPSHVRPVGSNRVVVADTRGNAVLSYALDGNPRQLGSVPVPGRAYGLDTDPERGLAYLTLANTNQVVQVRIGPEGQPEPGPILPTVRQPNDVAVDPRDGTVYVIGQAGAEVQPIPARAFGS